MKALTLGLVTASIALLLTGCTGSASNNESSNSSTSSATGNVPNTNGKKLRVAMVFDSGGKGDKSFNDSANAGLERAKSELGVEIQTVDSKDEKDYEVNLDTLAEQGYDLVIAVGITQNNALLARRRSTRTRNLRLLMPRSKWTTYGRYFLPKSKAVSSPDTLRGQLRRPEKLDLSVE